MSLGLFELIFFKIGMDNMHESNLLEKKSVTGDDKVSDMTHHCFQGCDVIN